jgi:NTP pyrophosphatase (non-canonical NTP hydrolase)
MKKTYYLYHIPGKKIGVTCNIYNRLVKGQGLRQTDYIILDSSDNIDYISAKELALQKKFNYKVDRQSYKNLVKMNEMKLNVTEATTTFPVSVKELKDYLAEYDGVDMEINHKFYLLTPELASYICNKAKPSMYRDGRCYIYNELLERYYDVAQSSEYTLVIFDDIRSWAAERGIYSKGDSKTQYVKLMEESGELARAILKNDKPEIVDAIGDMVVVLTNLAKLEGLNIEDCIASAYKVIASRKGAMVNGTFVKTTL